MDANSPAVAAASSAQPEQTATLTPTPAAASSAPSHVILIDDFREWLAGKVMKADSALLAALIAGGAKFREATPRERSIGGFFDHA
jgi:hypothetical protein